MKETLNHFNHFLIQRPLNLLDRLRQVSAWREIIAHYGLHWNISDQWKSTTKDQLLERCILPGYKAEADMIAILIRPHKFIWQLERYIERSGLIFQWFGIKICSKLCFNHWISIEIGKSIKWKMSCIEIGEKRLIQWLK
jgi:hypothetical protein